MFNLLQSYVRQPAPDHSSQPTAGHSARLNSIDLDQLAGNPELPTAFETQISNQLDDLNGLLSGPTYMNVNVVTNNVVTSTPLNLECSMPNVPPPSLPMAASAAGKSNFFICNFVNCNVINLNEIFS